MRLAIIRHAQAESRACSDHQRPLSCVGRRQVSQLRTKIGNLIDPDIVIHSDAVRTTQTSELLGYPCQTLSLHELYHGGITDYLEALENYGGDSAVIVGHEPTVSALAAYVSEKSDMRRGVSTATVLIFEGELCAGGMQLCHRLHSPAQDRH